MLEKRRGGLCDHVEALVELDRVRLVVTTLYDRVGFQVVGPAAESPQDTEKGHGIHGDVSNTVRLTFARTTRDPACPASLVVVTPVFALGSLCRAPKEAGHVMVGFVV